MISPLPVLSQTDRVNETVIAIIRPAEEPKPQPKKYQVQDNDNLSKIAEAHQTTIQRLWAANPALADPNLLNVNQELTIPLNTDVLADRPFPAKVEPVAPTLVQSAPSRIASVGSSVSGGLTGTLGRVSPYGNCVDEPGVNSPRNGTNPIAWPILTQQAYIGATALWTYNHTGVVVGIWDNGDIEVRHQNYSYPQTRFPRSAFRGFR